MLTIRHTGRALTATALPALALVLTVGLRPTPPAAHGDPVAAAAFAVWVLLVLTLAWWTVTAVAFGLAVLTRSERWTARTARVTPQWIRRAIASAGALAFLGVACVGVSPRPADAAVTHRDHHRHRVTTTCVDPAPPTPESPTTSAPPAAEPIVREPSPTDSTPADPNAREPGPTNATPTPSAPTTTPSAGQEPIVRADPGGDPASGHDNGHDNGPVVTPTPSQPAEPAPTTTPGAPRVEGDPVASHHHVVVPGESLWTIARDLIVAVRHEQPTDAQLAPYWRAVVDANRATLRSGNPNLIFPGEVVTLPPLG